MTKEVTAFVANDNTLFHTAEEANFHNAVLIMELLLRDHMLLTDDGDEIKASVLVGWLLNNGEALSQVMDTLKGDNTEMFMPTPFHLIPDDWYMDNLSHFHKIESTCLKPAEPQHWVCKLQHINGGRLTAGNGKTPAEAVMAAIKKVLSRG